jgi:hypothetical protein
LWNKPRFRLEVGLSKLVMARQHRNPIDAGIMQAVTKVQAVAALPETVGCRESKISM